MLGIQKLPLAAISSRNCRVPPLKVIQVVFIVSILRSIEQASAKQLACQHLGQHHLRWQFASGWFPHPLSSTAVFPSGAAMLISR
jgi:hypothetical protein